MMMKGMMVGKSFRWDSWSNLFLLLVCLSQVNVEAKNSIRTEFFEAYPSAVGSCLDALPSNDKHCGVCHYDFNGGGLRNAFGLAVEATPDRTAEQIFSLDGEDSDEDGFKNGVEITDLSFTNTPTFPGLKASDAAGVVNIPLEEIQDYLVPMAEIDTTPPEVAVISPDGSETITANSAFMIEWTAADASGVAGVDIYLSDDNGVTFKPVALGLANTGEHEWFPANRPASEAVLLIVAFDNVFNSGQDQSDAAFSIISPPGGIVPTTLRDFDMPGSQPFEAGTLNDPGACAVCHADYDVSVEPYRNWQGSMMSQASLDVLFKANLVIANQDAPDSGDLCLRCHLPRGWLRGRSVPTDGSAMLPTDMSGVSCDLCHRLVDPIASEENPVEDAAVLAALSFPGHEFGNGMYVVDPTGARRGPFVDATSGHPILVSPFHREAAICGTCHDVSNTAFEDDGQGSYVPNEFDTTAADFSANILLPVERTYSEWFNSAYNSPGGIYAPQFGGNKAFVGSCQDCHMKDVTGKGCNLEEAPIRDDLPLHDMTGGSTWLPGLLDDLYPEDVNETALQAGIVRARYMLQKAAALIVEQEGEQLKVSVFNETGHKLPTGYPEGRRMWINVRFYNDSAELIGESAAYDSTTGHLDEDEQAKIYEIKPGLDSITAPLVGVDEGPSFHFVLNNKVFKDNRIPPQGFTNAAFEEFGGSPVDYSYEDGQFWDDTYYDIPQGSASVVVSLYYQSTSKEFIEFLRDENQTNSEGQQLYDLWNENEKCPPELMQQAEINLLALPLGNFDGDTDVDMDDFAILSAAWFSVENEANWNGDCDLYADGVIDTADLAVFVTNWLAGR
jgi:hypothetical protein